MKLSQPFNVRRTTANSSVGRRRRGNTRASRQNRDASLPVTGMREAPRETWNGKEGGPGLVPINQLITNSFIPAFNKLSYNGRLRYGAAGLQFTATTGTVGNYFFTANGLFDPNISGGSLRPAGFDQLMLSYDHYVVTKSRCSVVLSNNGTSSVVVCLRVDADSTGTTDPNNLLEQPQAQIVTLEPQGVYGSTKTLTLDCDVARYNGLPNRQILSDPVFRGDVASNPVEQSYFVLSTYGVKLDASVVNFQVVIDYWATFQEPRELSPSLSNSLISFVREDAVRKKNDAAVSQLRNGLFSDTSYNGDVAFIKGIAKR